MAEQQGTGAPRGGAARTAIEVLGLACLVAFWWFVWPPLVLLVAGLLLVVLTNLRQPARDPNRQRLADRLGRALAAYRAAYEAAGRR